MCSEQGLAEEELGSSDLERVREGDNEVSITKVLSAVYDEYRYNNTFCVAVLFESNSLVSFLFIF